jgi:sugar phosphate isomerase/epimerase
MTLWLIERHPFIHILGEARELIAAIGTGNVGFQIDSWHWFTADERKQISHVRNEDIVRSISTMPAIPLDKQIDSARGCR